MKRVNPHPPTATPERPRSPAARRAVATIAEALPPAAEGDRKLRRIADTLRRLATDLEDQSAESPDDADGGAVKLGERRDLARFARAIYAMRRKRGRALGDEGLFGEPAWDILLDLYIAESEGTRLPVTSACIGAAVPTTTALRWLNILETRGLIARKEDPCDARRTYVRISREGRHRVEDVLADFVASLAALERQPEMLASR
jgi:DNA-binding MarR family transcriptional regulator